MPARTGTSGFSFAEWKGRFYPEKLTAAKMLGFYATRLATVEINATFYKLPTRATLAAWAAQVPPHFQFALKASRFVTHSLKLANAETAVGSFFELASALGHALGPLLVQVPAFVRNDELLLKRFLEAVPNGKRVAMDFRDPSWKCSRTYAILRDYNAAWVVTESDTEAAHQPDTADWCYLRLRKSFYSNEELSAWAVALRGRDALVYFRHEDQAHGPACALSLAGHFASPLG